MNDRAAWTSTELYLRAGEYFSSPDEFVLGDGGFEGEDRHLRTSYKMPQQEWQVVFNSMFTQVRKNVENAIGSMKTFARILQGANWRYDLGFFSLVVHASCVLHNYKLRTRGLRYNAYGV